MNTKETKDQRFERELGELEAKDIEKAIQGDFGARMRVEVVFPFVRILNDLGPACEEILKKNPGLTKEQLQDLPSVKKIRDDLVQCISTQIYAIICNTSAQEAHLMKIADLAYFIQEVHAAANATLLKMILGERF